MTNKIKNIKDLIVKIFEEGGNKADAARAIREKTGLGGTQSKYWAKQIWNEYFMFNDREEDSDEDSNKNAPQVDDFINDLEYSKKYVYNKSDDKYIFLLHDKLGKNIVLSGNVVRSLIKTYTNYDGEPLTINQTALKYKIPRNILIVILRILGVTHDAIPFTSEYVHDKDENDLVDEYIQDKKFNVFQKIQKRDWNETKEDANKWNAFICGKLDPFQTVLESWTPPEFDFGDINPNTIKSNKKLAFMTVLTDNHIGELTKNSYVNGEYNSKIATNNIKKYLKQINEKVNQRTHSFEKVVLVCLGDIINSFVDGRTRKGTELDNDIINEELFDLGLDVLVYFVMGLKNIFGRVEVNCTKGNHDSLLIYALYKACEKYFQNDDSISFNITKKYIDSFKIYNNLFLFSHGATDSIKSGLPKNSTKLENLIQSLLLSKAEDLIGVTSRYFITGHTHSFEHIEKNEFEFIVCSASVNSDEYAESLGYWSKPRQQSFIVSENYLEETLHFNL